MRSIRTIPLLAGVLALALGSTAFACSGDQTKVSGTFDASGRFVLDGAWDAKGAAIANTKGMVLDSFTTADNLVLSASTMTGKAVCLFGDLDAANKTMNVSGFKECGASCDPAACASKGASAAAAGGSACGAKAATMQAAGGAHCASKSADAAAASAGQCASKGAAVKAASAGSGAACASGAVAKTASAKTASADGCCPSGAAAKTASAGASCETKAASAGASCASKGADAAAASAKTADSKAACDAKSTLVYSVSGMTCGGCASQVKSAVAKVANVGECTVDLEKAQAVVTTTGQVDAAEIGKAITAAGFPAQLAPADAPAEAAKS